MKLFELLYEKRERERRQRKINSAKNIVLGSVIGVVAGIMLAPKSGKETRQCIVDKSKTIKENTKSSIKDSINTIKEMEGKVKEKVKEFKNRDMFEIELKSEEDPE